MRDARLLWYALTHVQALVLVSFWCKRCAPTVGPATAPGCLAGSRGSVEAAASLASGQWPSQQPQCKAEASLAVQSRIADGLCKISSGQSMAQHAASAQCSTQHQTSCTEPQGSDGCTELEPSASLISYSGRLSALPMHWQRRRRPPSNGDLATACPVTACSHRTHNAARLTTTLNPANGMCWISHMWHACPSQATSILLSMLRTLAALCTPLRSGFSARS